MAKKRGKLSLDEEATIRKHCNDLSVGKIAEMLNRNDDPINRYIRENGLRHTGLSESDAELHVGSGR